MTEIAEKSCRRCDRPISDGARYCSSCGYSTKRPQTPVDAVAVILIVLGVMLFIMDRLDRDED